MVTCSVSSCAGHMTMETVYRQTLALQHGNGDEHRPLELDTAGLNVKGNLYLYRTIEILCFNTVITYDSGEAGTLKFSDQVPPSSSTSHLHLNVEINGLV